MGSSSSMFAGMLTIAPASPASTFCTVGCMAKSVKRKLVRVMSLACTCTFSKHCARCLFNFECESVTSFVAL